MSTRAVLVIHRSTLKAYLELESGIGHQGIGEREARDRRNIFKRLNFYRKKHEELKFIKNLNRRKHKFEFRIDFQLSWMKTLFRICLVLRTIKFLIWLNNGKCKEQEKQREVGTTYQPTKGKAKTTSERGRHMRDKALNIQVLTQFTQFLVDSLGRRIMQMWETWLGTNLILIPNFNKHFLLVWESLTWFATNRTTTLLRFWLIPKIVFLFLNSCLFLTCFLKLMLWFDHTFRTWRDNFVVLALWNLSAGLFYRISI